VSVRVALVGCGVWGKNLLRALVESPRAEVVAVADLSPGKLARAGVVAPRAALVTSLEEVLSALPTAVVIATPANTHGALVLEALDAGLDVFVEKPLAQSREDADRCAARAAALGRVGMVGHLLRYHPSVERLIELTREPRFGALRHFTAERLSSASDRASSILWSLGPHDLSVLRALDPSPIAAVEAEWRDDGDRITVNLGLESGVTARIELARSNPTKERRLAVVGSALAGRFDDVRASDRIALEGAEGALAGEILVAWREPLALEIDHFLECVERRATPRTSFEEGASVVRALARIEAAAGGAAGSVARSPGRPITNLRSGA
jgi:predicted dehydrogenase